MFQKTLTGVLVGSVALVVLFLSTAAVAQAEKIGICHATSSADNPYTFNSLPRSAIFGPAGHFNEDGTPQAGHEQDFFSADGDCDRGNDPGGPGGNPDPVPEPITMLLFGAGLAGVGYASRRYLKRSKDDDSTEV